MELQSYEQVFNLINKVFKIPRSITGDGVKKTLQVFEDYIQFQYSYVPTGESIDTWTVPLGWEVQKCELLINGLNQISYFENNLHSMVHSQDFFGTGKLKSFKDNIYYNSNLPNAVPYVTSYYGDNKGLCLTKNMYKQLEDKNVEINLQTKFFESDLTIAEYTIPGKSDKQVVINTYLCHPAMANNELSGPLASIMLFKKLQKRDNFFTYKLTICPETIGAIAYNKYNLDAERKNIMYGLVLTCLGGPSKKLTYKKSKEYEYKNLFNNHLNTYEDIIKKEYDPTTGSNERQFNHPTVRLPYGQFSKTTYGTYAEYHNSFDNIQFLKIEEFINTVDQIYEIICDFDTQYQNFSQEENQEYLSNSNQPGALKAINKYGEPFLSNLNLYHNVNDHGGDHTNFGNVELFKKNLLLFLNNSDGTNSPEFLQKKFNISKETLDVLVKSKIVNTV